HLEATRTRVTPRGQFSLWQRTMLVMVVTDDERHRTVPITSSRPAKLRVGQHWVQDYRVGGIRTVSRNRVTRRCSYAGRSFFVIVADSKVTGEHPGTERDVTWESQSTGMTLYETIDRKIGGSFPYEMHVELRLLR